jgi:hypothetical protein
MPDLNIQERNNKCVAVRKASIVYGNEFLIDTFPSDQPYPGAWGLIIVPQQYPSAPPHKYYFCNTPAANKESPCDFISEWPEKTDSFTQEDLLNTEDEQVQELIFRVKTSLFIPYRQRLANRLIALFKDAKEEDPTCPGIAVGSLRNFYNFLQLHTTIKCPTISLTPEYNIYASWRDNQKRIFSVHFLPNGDVRFVIFTPNDKHPERQIRHSVSATTDILKETVSPYGVWDWISE